MHLLLPITHNHRPLLAGRQQGWEPCTTMLVHDDPLNNLTIIIGRLIPATMSMATRP